MKTIKAMGALLLFFVSTFTHAIEHQSCEIKHNNVTIDITNEYYITVLCNKAYTSYYSDLDRIPYLVTENVTRSNLSQKEPRTNDFRPDLRLPPKLRSTLKDYYRSGYDRGHMAPAGDTNDHETISESFLLSNMTPQNPELNRTLWKNIENYARIKANLNGQAFVITGVTFNHCLVEEKLQNRVAVPDKYFKIILSGGKIDSFMVDNIHPRTLKIHEYRTDLKTINEKLCGIRIKVE